MKTCQSGVLGQPGVPGTLDIRLGYMMLCLKNKHKNRAEVVCSLMGRLSGYQQEECPRTPRRMLVIFHIPT